LAASATVVSLPSPRRCGAPVPHSTSVSIWECTINIVLPRRGL
jgi:hypothetical protein